MLRVFPYILHHCNYCLGYKLDTDLIMFIAWDAQDYTTQSSLAFFQKFLYCLPNSMEQVTRIPNSLNLTASGLCEFLPFCGGRLQWMVDLLKWGVQVKSCMIDRGPHRVSQATLDIRSGENLAAEPWRRSRLRKPFSKKIKLSRWFKHMFLILIKYLFFLEKTCFEKTERKINNRQGNLFCKCPRVKANEKMYLLTRSALPYFGNLFFSPPLYCVYNSLFHVTS